MCGRFSLSTEPTRLAEIFGLSRLPQTRPRFNIAPTQQVLVVLRDTAGRAMRPMRWGLIPPWADDPAIGNRLVNARSETAAAKPAFRHAFRQRRCLLPADAFYEWQKVGPKGKQPYAIRMADDSTFALAGLWERWQPQRPAEPAGPGGTEVIETCTVLTTTANDLVGPIHDRMPVILDARDWDRWLDVEQTDAAAATALMQPFPAARMKAFRVSKLVNQYQRDDPRCLDPATDTSEPDHHTNAPPRDAQMRLF
jgi:putative SOS response-associated peptidase YedK